MKKKVVLAYSGGLDTSYCIKYLNEEKGLDVYTVIVNTGGFSENELQRIRTKALTLGAKEHHVLNETNHFYNDCLRYLIMGNMMRAGNYPMCVSSERVFQAKAIAEFAKQLKADYIAHGSTGAGNDQVRFDLTFRILCPEIEILTPIRDQKLSRKEETDYLIAKGVEMNWEKSKYSINKGLWGTTIGGEETLSSDKTLPEEAWTSIVDEKTEGIVLLHFEQGELCGINETNMKAIKAIKLLNELGSRYGIGRDIHVGDTIVGIKGRVGFEAPAPVMILKAHQLLEKHTLTKWQQYWKEQLSNWYGMFLHEGQFFEPVMRNIEKFLLDTQKTVNGTVALKLMPYTVQTIGISSKNDLMKKEFGMYGEENNMWNGEDVKGYTKILSNASKIYYTVNQH